jgi:uncharacterized iron-regulated membrane protein
MIDWKFVAFLVSWLVVSIVVGMCLLWLAYRIKEYFEIMRMSNRERVEWRRSTK